MCSRCRSFRAPPGDAKLPQGFGYCAHLPVWHYRSQREWGCHFVPSRFVATE